MKVGESFDGENNVLEVDGRGGSVAVFDDRTIGPIMNVDFDASESVFQIDQVPFDSAVTEKLIAGKVRVMGGVAVVVIKRFLNIDSFIFIIIVE
jgi:hypothetical protein